MWISFLLIHLFFMRVRKNHIERACSSHELAKSLMKISFNLCRAATLRKMHARSSVTFLTSQRHNHVRSSWLCSSHSLDNQMWSCADKRCSCLLLSWTPKIADEDQFWFVPSSNSGKMHPRFSVTFSTSQHHNQVRCSWFCSSHSPDNQMWSLVFSWNLHYTFHG